MSRKKRIQERDVQAENRKHALRERKERRERQLLLAVLVPVLVVVLVVVGIGAYRELYQTPRTPVARIEGETITASQFIPRVQWYRRQVLNNLQSFMQLAMSSDPSFLTNMADQQRQGAADATVDQLIDEVLVRKEAERRGIQVADADIDERIKNDLSTVIAPPTTESALEATVGPGTPVTPTAAVTTTSTPISTERIGEEFRTALQPVLDQVGLSIGGYRNIVRQLLFRERLGENMVPEVQKQVEAAYMRFTSEETAKQAAAALAGGASWDETSARFQMPTATPAVTAEAESPEGATAVEGATAATPTAAEEGAPVASATVEPTETEPAATETIAATATVSVTLATTDTRGARAGVGSAVTGTTGLTVTSPSGGRAAGASAAPTSATPPTPTATPDPYASTVGERAWLARDDIKQQWSLSDADADAVLAIPKGKSGGPFKAAGDMFYVVFVFDAQEERKVEQDRLRTLRDQAVSDWLTKRKEEIKPDKFPLEGITPPEPAWFLSAWEQLFPAAQPTLDLGTLTVPTVFAPTVEPAMPVTSTGGVTTTGATQ